MRLTAFSFFSILWLAGGRAQESQIQIGEFRFQSLVSRQEGDDIVYLVSDLRFRNEETRLTGDYAVLWLDGARYAKLFDRSGDGDALHRTALSPPSRGRLPPSSPPTLIGSEKSGPDKEERSLPADLIREMYVEGAVFFEQGEERILQGSSLYMDLVSGRALIAEGVLRTSKAGLNNKPIALSVKADWFRREATGRFVADNAKYTTCSFGKPHQHIHSDQLWIEETEQGSAVDAYRSTLNIEDTGLFYLPRTVLDPEVKDMLLLRKIQYGKSSHLGAFFYTLWGQRFHELGEDFNEWILGERLPFRGDWQLRIDRRSKRGLGFGPEISWETRDRYKGRVQAYFADDEGYDRTFYANEIVRTQEQRAFAILQNRIWFEKEWTFDTELAYLSDPSFLPEFFRKEYFRDKEPETAAYLRWARNNQVFSALVTGPLNSFDPALATGFVPPAGTTVFEPPALKEALPELRHEWLHEPLFRLSLPAGTGDFRGLDLPIYYTEKSSIGYLRRHPSKGIEFQPGTISFLPAETLASARFDTSHELSAPYRADPFVITPFVGQRYTAYSADVTADEISRYVGSAGIRVTTHLEGPVGEEWIHGVDPSVSYENIYAVTRDPADLISFDETETVVKGEKIVLGLRNRLWRPPSEGQGKKAAQDPIERWRYPLDLDLRLPVFLNPDRDNAGQRYGDLEVDLSFQSEISSGPFRQLWSVSEFAFAVREPGPVLRRMNFAEAIVGSQPTDNLGVFLRHRRYRDISGGAVLNTGLGGGFNYRINEKWALIGFENYNFEIRKTESRGFTLRRLGHDWVIEVATEFNDATDERTFFLNVQPTLLFRRGRGLGGLSQYLKSSFTGQDLYTE